MTLKKSSSKSTFWSVFFTQLYQMRLLLALFAIAFLVIPNLATLAEFTNRQWSQYRADEVKDYILLYVGIFGYAPMVGLSMAMSVMQFGYLHKRQKLDYFHALPVRRTTHFMGRNLSALFVLMCAAVIIALGQTLSLGFTMGFGEPSVFGFIWFVCLLIVLPAFAAYQFTTLMIVLTATLWETIFSLLAVSALHPVIMMFTNALISASVPISNFVLEWETATFLSPLLYGIGSLFTIQTISAWQSAVTSFLVIFAQILVCGALAWYFFRLRRSEQAESSSPTRFKLVVQFSTAACASTMLGLALLYITEVYAGYLFGSVLGLLIAWVVQELLYRRTLRKALKGLVPNLLGYGVFAVINFLVAFGLIGVPSLPHLEEINAVSVSYNQDVRISDTQVHTENFHNMGEYVYTGAEPRYVRMASFEEEDVSIGRAMAELMLKNQKELYFPYTPTKWSYRDTVDLYNTPDRSYVEINLYMEDTALSLRYDDFSTRGEMETIYEMAKSISRSEEYKNSCPSVAVMEKLQYVMYEDYSKYDTTLQLTLDAVDDRESFIRDLQAAYLEDLYYSTDYENHAEGMDLPDVDIMTEFTIEDAKPIPTDNEGSYVLNFDVPESAEFFDPEESITLKGGIIDDFYPAEGLECWLTPQLTEEEIASGFYSTIYRDSTIYLYRVDFPRTCAVLDRLNPDMAE